MLGGKSGAFLRELPEPLGMNVIGRTRFDADRLQRRDAIEELGEGAVARHSRRLPYPDQEADRRPSPDPEHRIKILARHEAHHPGEGSLHMAFAPSSASAAMRSKMEIPGMIIRRRRNSAISAWATFAPLAGVRAIGSNQT